MNKLPLLLIAGLCIALVTSADPSSAGDSPSTIVLSDVAAFGNVNSENILQGEDLPYQDLLLLFAFLTLTTRKRKRIDLQSAEQEYTLVADTSEKLKTQFSKILVPLEKIIGRVDLPANTQKKLEDVIRNTNNAISLLNELINRKPGDPPTTGGYHFIDQRHGHVLQLIPSDKTEIHSSPLSEVDLKFLEKCLHTINENLGNSEFTVVELGREVGLSRAQLFRRLKLITGQAPTELIYTTRLKKALQFIRTRNFTISEIAYMCGFSNPSSFSTTFRKYYGKSPKTFLNEQFE